MSTNESAHVMPWWMGYFLTSRLRDRRHDPVALLSPYVKAGQTALDVGCGMGYFSLPLARMVGPGGRVVCVDLQAGMIRPLLRRARRAGVADRVEARVCRATTLDITDLSGKVDFALLFAVLHEVPDPERLVRELSEALRGGGLLFFGEPSGHVDETTLEREIALITAGGFQAAPTRHPAIEDRSVVFRKAQP